VSGSVVVAPGPSESLSFDEFLGEAFANASERVFTRLAEMECRDHERRVASGVLSAAAVSAHWLLATDEDVPGGLASGVSSALRERFERGERPDRDLIEWVVGVCAAVLVATDLGPADREPVLAIVSRTLEFDGLLNDLAGMKTERDEEADRMGLLDRAAAALNEGTLPECEFSPLALQLVTERFQGFLGSI
jgi:hypothetical protein